VLVALAAIAAYIGWAFHAASEIGFGWAGLRPALPYLLAGVVTVECVIAAFVWLALFSERRGYDDRATDHAARPPGDRRR
jgi:hypothetical protein